MESSLCRVWLFRGVWLTGHECVMLWVFAEACDEECGPPAVCLCGVLARFLTFLSLSLFSPWSNSQHSMHATQRVGEIWSANKNWLTCTSLWILSMERKKKELNKTILWNCNYVGLVSPSLREPGFWVQKWTEWTWWISVPSPTLSCEIMKGELAGFQLKWSLSKLRGSVPFFC